MKIISFKICPFVQRVTALLEAKKLPYEIEFIDLKHKPQWFLNLAPNGQVPVLVTDNGTALFESDAIVEYIDDISDPLEPALTPEEKAHDRAWNYLASKHYLVQCGTMRSVDQDTLLQKMEKLKKAFAKAEAILQSGPYLKGKNLSNIDIAWLPLLHRANIIREKSGYDMLCGLPKAQSWQAALMQTDLPQKSVADDFETAFTKFYLAPETFLGSEPAEKLQALCCTVAGAESCSEGCC